MSMKAIVRAAFKRSSLIGCGLLALFATVISLSLSILTGCQLGESLMGKLVLAAFGVLAVLVAHLLLALCRSASLRVQLVAIVLWLCCMAYAAFSHASFFLQSQQQAGMRRVAAMVINDVGSSQKLEPKRGMTEILSDQVKIKTELAIKSQIHCVEGCFTLKVRLVNLQARLDALNIEADELKRWRAQQDRQDEQRGLLRDDPVTLRLAKLLGVTVVQMGLITSLLFSGILEGVACLCWYVVFQTRDSLVTQSAIQSVTSDHAVVMTGHADEIYPSSDSDSVVEELIREVKAERLKLTVSAVRVYCKCAQSKAAELKRQVEAKLHGDAQAC